MQAYLPNGSPSSPWRPLPSEQTRNDPWNRARAKETERLLRRVRKRRTAIAANMEYKTACIVEFFPESDGEADNGSHHREPPTSSFIGWFPPVVKKSGSQGGSKYTLPPPPKSEDCVQFRIGLDLAKHENDGDSDDYDSDEPESDVAEDYDDPDDSSDDIDVDDDLTNVRCPAPLLWLRFPLDTAAPAGASLAAQARLQSDREQQTAKAAAILGDGGPVRAEGDPKRELVHLALPAHVFLPKRPEDRDGALTARPASHRKPQAAADFSAPPPGPAISLTRYTAASARSRGRASWQPPDYVLRAAADAFDESRAFAASSDGGARQLVADCNAFVRSLCFVDIVAHPHHAGKKKPTSGTGASSTSGSSSKKGGGGSSTSKKGASGTALLPVIAARWLRLPSAAANAFVRDVRAASATTRVRIHTVYHPDLAAAVEECAAGLGCKDGGEEDYGDAEDRDWARGLGGWASRAEDGMESFVEVARLKRARRLIERDVHGGKALVVRGEKRRRVRALQGKRAVVVGRRAWANVVEWTPEMGGGCKGDGMLGGWHKLSSAVDKMRLAEDYEADESECEDVDDEDEDGEEEEKFEAVVERTKKRKVERGKEAGKDETKSKKTEPATKASGSGKTKASSKVKKAKA